MFSNVAATSFSYKDLLLKKLYYPVTCSVLAQIFVLQVYLFIVNFDLLHPLTWIKSTFNTLHYFTTWLFIVCFLAVVFLQSIVCAKDYVINSTYSKNRLQKLISVFSFHNFILLALHVLIGGALVWLFLSLGGGPYQDLLYRCKHRHYCVNEGKFFLMFGGLWSGLYYFMKIYVTGKHLVFPVVYQRKLIQFKAKFLPLLRESILQSSWPTVYFIIFYYFWGSQVKNKFIQFFSLQCDSSDDTMWWKYFSLWLLGTLYFLSMNLMRFFFNLFITEAVNFPLIKSNENVLTLQDAILMEDFPIIQKLACQDLFLLSRWSLSRRQLLFTLSQPGGHAHNWNSLIRNTLQLLTYYTELLNKSSDSIIVTDKTTQACTNMPQFDTSISSLQSPNRHRNFRNMSMYWSGEPLIFTSPYRKPVNQIQTSWFMKTVTEKFKMFISVWKIILGITYFFGELPQINIQKSLANGHVIIWMSQGISELSVRSLTEDRYGVVQKDLPVLLTTLVQLRQSLEKLNKIPALSKRVAGSDDFNYKMKNAVLSAIKRSLFNLGVHFGEYISDFPLSKDILQQLHPYIALCKNN